VTVSSHQHPEAQGRDQPQGHDHDHPQGHDHDHPHGNDHPHGHGHPHGNDHPHGHGHPHGHDHGDGHGHEHPSGLRGFFYGLFVPHSHDAADSIDDALEASTAGVRAVKLSLVGLGVTALLQLVVVVVSGSVALLADTIHNFSDALTAVPLWVAFVLGRRAASRRYTYGYGRVEDLAGLFIVAMIALSAVVAGFEAVRRFFEPQPVNNLGWVLAAGLVGFLGNELVAVYRIRVGRRIGSAALVADGVHARTDGFTSLAVVLGVVGIWLGFPLADPIVALAISVAIFVLLWGTARDIGRRLLDGVDPALVGAAEDTVAAVPGIAEVDELRIRWIGHRLDVEATVTTDPTMPVGRFHELEHGLTDALRQRLPSVQSVRLIPSAHVPVPTGEPAA
jgi:cation diffusion facilitator family transporter